MENQGSKFKVEFKKRLYQFTLELIGFIDKLRNDNVSRRIGDQLLKSGTSVIANFVEGQAASSKKDLINYLHISLKSGNESKLWLSLLKDTKRCGNEEAELLIDELTQLTKILATSILKLKGMK